MYITPQTIITFTTLLGALGTLIGVLLNVMGGKIAGKLLSEY